MRVSRRLLVVAATGVSVALSVLLSGPSRSQNKAKAEVNSIPLRGAGGRIVTLPSFTDRPVRVVVFMGLTCPAANGYVPLLNRLQLRYAARGLQVLGVFAQPSETTEAIERHHREFALQFPSLRDDNQRLADVLGAVVTPQAFLIDAAGAVHYRGRIDSSYPIRPVGADKGVGDLEQAIVDHLSGVPVKTSKTTAVGCSISRRAEVSSTALTFHRDILPILQRRCQTCHREGQSAPFSLATFSGVRERAGGIRSAVEAATMPPWKAEAGYGDFADCRRLTGIEKSTLLRWIDAGTPEGNAADAPPARIWRKGWELGKPDLILTASEGYTVDADGEDEFRAYVIPTGLLEDKEVVGIDMDPSNPRAVHHVMAWIDPTGNARKLDAADPEPGWAVDPNGIGFEGAGILGLWNPGKSAQFLPKDVARQLPGGADLVLQVHYHPTGKPQIDRPRIALYFGRRPSRFYGHMFAMGGEFPPIPASASAHKVRLVHRFPGDFHLTSIQPHMHLLGKEMRATLTRPDGTRSDLVWVKHWDFRWQESYRYRRAVFIPAGSKLEIDAVFDNSDQNPRNFNRPPRDIPSGNSTNEEMASVILEGVSADATYLTFTTQPENQ